jgi:hypothetical protein
MAQAAVQREGGVCVCVETHSPPLPPTSAAHLLVAALTTPPFYVLLPTHWCESPLLHLPLLPSHSFMHAQARS